MKFNKSILLTVLCASFISLTVACNNNNNQSQESKPLEVGDIVKEWKSIKDYEEAPLQMSPSTSSAREEHEIVSDFGHEDKSSIKYDASASKTAILRSDSISEPFFSEDDAKNGDIVSLYFYLPSDSNVSSLQLQIFPSVNKTSIKGKELSVNEENTEVWTEMSMTYDSLETLGAISLYIKPVDSTQTMTFYLDDIKIVYGEETVLTGYEYNDESLYQASEDFFKVGSCMSGDMLKNTELRKIAKHNFNSLTAENEAKPERILDQKACQALAKEDEGAVAITVAPFEKIYDFCAKNNIKVRHHTFVWYSQVPAWFFNKGYKDSAAKVSKDIMLQRMENFIKITLETVNERWPGLVYAIDVANEAVENHNIRNNNNNWYTVIGKDFVYYAFKYARQYAEDWQKLYYNDWSFDNDYENCKYALNTLLKSVIEEGLVDGVGIQGHKGVNEDFNVLMKDAKLIQEKGLECQITELDITIGSTSKTEYANQKKIYKNFITNILKSNAKGETNINALIVWGIRDNESWKRSQYPLLFTEKYEKKPAYYGFLEAVQEYKASLEEVSE